jgi:membrane protein implicated in regulation of membrane protease activity
MLTLVAAVLAFVFLDGAWRWAAIACGAALDVAESGAFLWWSRRPRPAVGVETLVGARAVVMSPCRPDGQVRVAGELWRARCDDGADPGDEVVVQAVDGLTVTVARARAA